MAYASIGERRAVGYALEKWAKQSVHVLHGEVISHRLASSHREGHVCLATTANGWRYRAGGWYLSIGFHREVRIGYLALVDGRWNWSYSTVKAPLGRDWRDGLAQAAAQGLLRLKHDAAAASAGKIRVVS